MRKVLVEVFLPAAAREFDVYIPLEITIREITRMLAVALEDLSTGQFEADGDVILCDADAEEILNPGNTAGELHIENGSRLILL